MLLDKLLASLGEHSGVSWLYGGFSQHGMRGDCRRSYPQGLSSKWN